MEEEKKEENKNAKKTIENKIAIAMFIVLGVIVIMLLCLGMKEDEPVYDDVFNDPDDWDYIDTRDEEDNVIQNTSQNDEEDDEEKEFKQNLQIIIARCTTNFYSEWANDINVKREDFYTEEIFNEELSNYNGECISYEKDEELENITLEIINKSTNKIYKLTIDYNTGSYSFIGD